MPTTDIDLRHSSICTDTPTGSDLFPFSEDPTQVIQNTGIERNGGITALYEQQTTFTTSATVATIAKDGTVIQVDVNHNVLLNGVSIGNVGTLAIYARGMLPGYFSDAAWTADNTIIGISRTGSTISVYEYDPYNATITNSRANVFATMPSGPILSLNLIKYVDMHYADNLEFVVHKSSTFVLDYILRELGTSATIFAAGYGPFAWKFAANKYITGLQNYGFYIGDIVGSHSQISTPSSPVWAIIDRYVGTVTSRAILTYPCAKDANNNISGIGEVGYLATGTYSAIPTYYGYTIGAATPTITYNVNGPGYSSCNFVTTTLGTTTYLYVAPYAHHVPGTYWATTSTNTQTPFNMYGKLTDIYKNTSNLVAWRVVMVASIPAMLSAAAVSSGPDNIGVPITNVGEFDERYIPHVDDDGSTYSRIIYRYNGNLFFVDIRPVTNTLYKVSDNVYGVNCLSPLNAINISKKKLRTGVTDYNGRFIPVGSSIGTSHKVVALIQSEFANSIDTGDLISTNGYDYQRAGWIPGIEIPSFVQNIEDYGINYYYADTYFNTVYSCATIGAASSYETVGDFVGLTYVADTRVPWGIGYTFYDHVINTEIETIFTGVGVTGNADINYDYLCYEIGNDIPGQYKGFQLYGQNYIFDGQNIWLTSFSGSLFSGKGNAPIAIATGMVFIAASPSEAFFLSAFDNSIYSFNGGRSLTKTKRLNDIRNITTLALEPILNGVFNVRDNTLLLQTANTFIWIRDSIATQNQKKANQVASLVNLFDTQNGIEIANNTVKWIYSYSALSGSTVVPLTFQTAFHSLKANETSEIGNWIVSVFSETKVSANIQLTCYSYDVDGFHSQPIQTISINAGDWDGLGFFRFRIQPQYRKALASSLKIYTTSHIVITEISIEYGGEGVARISAKRSA